MKVTLLAMFVALLMVGYVETDLSDPDEVKDVTADAVDWSKLQDRSGVTYLPNADKPFSGYAKQVYENEQIGVLAQFKGGHVVRVKQWQENGTPQWDIVYTEGKVAGSNAPLEDWLRSPFPHHNGVMTLWYDNGQKQLESNWKGGKQVGLSTAWHENGQKSFEANYKDNKKDGLSTAWYESGQKERKGNYKDGKLMSAVAWKPNGVKCPVTNLKDGNGVWVFYKENGTESSRHTYKDGEIVRD